MPTDATEMKTKKLEHNAVMIATVTEHWRHTRLLDVPLALGVTHAAHASSGCSSNDSNLATA